MPIEYKPDDIDYITWSLRMADWDRAQRRTQINALFNGTPPYSKKEQEDSGITINVNDLSGPRAAHEARAQFNASFMKPGAYFNCRTDVGRKDKRQAYGRTVTTEAAKIMKRSIAYTETQRSKWAMTILHGISPCVFKDADCWRPRAIGIEDILVPSNTELMDIAEGEMTFIPVYRTFNGTQLIKLAKGPRPDPAWNQKLVDGCIKWINEESLRLTGSNWQDFWSPEKWEERIKGDGVVYSTDTVPTINVWDFYFWNDEKDVQGWNRRMILDSWTMPDGPNGARTRRTEPPFNSRDQFLYDPGKRKWANSRQEIINWQFADLSAVAPFRYHTVRSLGYLLYSVCHLQNRLRCKFNEAVFEQLMVLMRVKSQDDMQRALSVNLVNRGFVDESIDFIKAGDRYQVNAQLAQMGLTENNNLITRNASSFTAKTPSAGDNKVPTATQWMGEEAKVTQLVSAGLMQAYEYQKPEYYEIFRRLTKKDSTDPDARKFQLNCLKAGVPDKVLYNYAAWDIEPERVLGAGNKTLEMAIAQQLMSYRHLYDPPAQRKILYDATLAMTDDPARAEALVPDEPMVSDSTHDAELAVAGLLLAQPMSFKANVSHGEYAAALISALEVEIAKINAMGGVPAAEHLAGLYNLSGVTADGQPIQGGNGVAAHIAAFSMDPESKSETKVLSDRLGKALNELRAFGQRLAEQREQAAQANGKGEMDPELQAKIESMLIMAEAKRENTRSSHAERTAQRQVQFEMEQQQKQAAADLALTTKAAETSLELQAQAAKSELEIQKEKMKAASSKKEPTASE